jgi:hypothetical protein
VFVFCEVKFHVVVISFDLRKGYGISAEDNILLRLSRLSDFEVVYTPVHVCAHVLKGDS